MSSAFALSLLAWAAPLAAHDLARSESRLEVHGAVVQCELTVDLLEFPGVDQDGNSVVSYAEFDRSIADIFAAIKAHLTLTSPADPIKIVVTKHELIDEHIARLTLVYTFPASVSRLTVTSTFDQLARRPDHQHYVTLLRSDDPQQAVLDASDRTVTFEVGRWTPAAIALTAVAVAIVGLRVMWFAVVRRRTGRPASDAGGRRPGF
jgi:hypothetical protein